MTVSSTTSVYRTAGNGVTTSFSYPARFNSQADLVVSLYDTALETTDLQVLNTDYTITGTVTNGKYLSGGNVIFGTPPPTGQTVIRERDLTLTQSSDYGIADPFEPDTLESDFDRLVLIDQQQQAEIDRGLRLPASSAVTGLTLPEPAAGNHLAWNATEDGLENIASLIGPTGPTGPTGPAGSVTDGDKGDIVVSASGVTWAIDSNAVTTAKINNGAVTEAKQTLADNTTNNASTSAHGYLKKLDNSATNFMNGQGNWAAPAAGAYVLLSAQTASASASLNFASVITSAYDYYVFVLKNLRPATNSVDFWIRTSTNNGSSYDATGYRYFSSGWDLFAASAITAAGTNSAAQILTNNVKVLGNGTDGGVSGIVELVAPLSTAYYASVKFDLFVTNASTGEFSLTGRGERAAAADVDAIQFLMSSGNITSGTIYCYGVKNT